MKRRINISIKQRIYWSFSLLVILFVINGVVTLLTINSNRKLASDIFKVLAPSIQGMDDFEKIMLESKMYTTNWVFLRYKQEDKELLKKLHDSDYAELKSRISVYSSQWGDKAWVDSLNRIYTGFEELLAIEKNIMSSLKVFEDYDDPVIKLEAERKVEEEVLPRTAALMNSLKAIHDIGVSLREKEGSKLERTSMKLRILIIALTITIILAGFLLSIYMTKVIIGPVNRIRNMINNLGQGVIQKIDQPANRDEIGKMILSVNNLSEKLKVTAAFAQEVGLRNYDMPFKPLSDQDSLGKALITMRDNIKISDEKLNDAQHIAHIGSWERNMETDKMTLSDEMFSIFGIDPLAFDFRFESIVRLVHPDDTEHVKESVRKNHYMAPMPFECRIVTSKGVIKNVFIETKLVLGKYGEIEKTFGIVQDITERKKAETQLHKSEERYRQIVETAQEGIWMVDENNKTNFVNKRLCEILGYTHEEMMGKELFYFMDEEGKKIATDSIEKGKQGDNENLDFKFITKTGAVIWTYMVNSPVLDDEGKYIGALAMVSDITRRKHDEELLQQSKISLAVNNKELEQKNKELEQFAYVASHDLQEPLRTTSSFVELLQQQYKGKLDERADKYLSFISQASDRMKILITDLLEYSRIGSKRELKEVDCNTVINEVLNDLDTAIIETGAEITTGHLPVIRGYQTEIKQLFQNLAFNSIKFRRKNVPPRITISALKKAGSWQFAFSDNGIGIAKEHNERIFVIFQRLHTRTEYMGSGIGLSHCKKIVDLHKGKIWLESEVGKGTTFYFTLPQNNN